VSENYKERVTVTSVQNAD